ncbi:MAG TPA: alanine dehydrogenase [Opitutae bacterium]|mgnify:CR=1 FL=1|nr:alanine dehydrogenase [Opitutae bacterium]|tara:strand:- start:1951 stop:3063 length:1113 start_codon:yes stop_codon:yes gene_type:complete
MKIGIPKEIKKQEARIALTPAAVRELIKEGHTVYVESTAGDGAGFPDESYRAVGAHLLKTHGEVFADADMIVKVKEPQPEEYPLLRSGQLLFCYLHLAASRELTEALVNSGVTGVAFETVTINGRLPLLEPMSEIAGRMSVLAGGHFLSRHAGGSGVLLAGAPGVLPAKVAILGGGAAGLNAARVAAGIGSEVTVFELDGSRIRYIDMHFPEIRTAYSNEHNVCEVLTDVDLLVGAVLVPGAKAPKLITRAMLAEMKRGSLLVDIAIDQGGCVETSRVTTHEDPTFIEEGIVHYCVGNMPGAYPRTSTFALTNSIAPFVQLLARLGLSGACLKQPSLVDGINVFRESVTCPGVAHAHDMRYVDPLTLMEN